MAAKQQKMQYLKIGTKLNWVAVSLIATIDNRILGYCWKMGDGKSAPVNECAKSTSPKWKPLFLQATTLLWFTIQYNVIGLIRCWWKILSRVTCIAWIKICSNIWNWLELARFSSMRLRSNFVRVCDEEYFENKGAVVVIWLVLHIRLV